MDTNFIFILATLLFLLFLLKTTNFENFASYGFLPKRELTKEEKETLKFGHYPSTFKNYHKNLWHRYWQQEQKESPQRFKQAKQYKGPIHASYKACNAYYYPIPYPIQGQYKTTELIN